MREGQQDPRRGAAVTAEPDTLADKVRLMMGSLRQMLALTGVGAIALGVVVFLFLRDLQGVSFIVLAVGGGLLLIDAAISWRTVARAIFGRGGRYGVTTVVILAGFVLTAVIGNYLLYYLVNRPAPLGWLRSDMTATNQFSPSDQARKAVENMKEPIRVNAFFTSGTAAKDAAWRETEDLLSEFKRRATTFPLEIRRIDPELEPNVAAEFGVTNYPALAIEGTESRRVEVVEGANPDERADVFTEEQVISGLLVVNLVKQKAVAFISGHSERDATDISTVEAYGLAAEALTRENYLVLNLTFQELASLLSANDPEQLPAAVVIADAKQELQEFEEPVLAEYARRGGNLLVLIEPDAVPSSLAGFLSRYGFAVGAGEVVDTASYVAPNPLFLQIKKSNGQLPDQRITQGFDVLYLAGSAYVATTVTPDTVPVTDSGRPFVIFDILASSTLQSWAETDPEIINFSADVDPAGPLPVAVAAEAVAELTGSPIIVDGAFQTTNIVVIGDTDFGSNGYFTSARNGDFFVNSVNWLVKDYELISERPRISAFRQFTLTTPERDFVRWTGWLLMPALIGLAGIWAWWARR